jgi:paraquat-inducible protein B
MSKQGNKTVIGAFVVGALVLAVVGILMFGSGKFFQKTHPVVMYFEGSVSGLSVGAPLVFRGVKIGSVKDIQLLYNAKDQSFRIPVYAELVPERATLLAGTRRFEENYRMLIEKGLRAQLVSQSFVTGQLMVALDLMPDKPAEFHGDGKIPEIPTVPTMLQELVKKLEDLPLEQLVKSIAGAAEGVDKLVNSPEVKSSLVALETTMKEIQQMAQSLNQQVTTIATTLDGTLKDYGKLARNADAQVVPLSSTAQETMKEYGTLARSAEGEIRGVTSGVKSTIQDYGKLARDADAQVVAMSTGVQRTLKVATGAMEEAEKALTSARKMTDEKSPLVTRVNVTLEELAGAARSIRMLADYLERHPEALIQGKGTPKGR